MKNKSLVSIADYSKNDILRILELAVEFEKDPYQQLLNRNVIATLFFEPSTRTGIVQGHRAVPMKAACALFPGL